MHIKLLWKNRNIGTSSVKIHRSLSTMNVNSLPAPIATVSGTETSYEDYDVVRGFTYYYRLSVTRGNETVVSDEFTVVAEPSNGPGAQTITAGNGDIEEGYFGTVSDLFTTNQLRAAAGLLSGSNLDQNPYWLKFAYRGKILFISQVPVANGLSWNDLYNAGLVYGVDGPGPRPVGSGVNQLRIIQKGNHRFKIRLMTGAEADPSMTGYRLDSISVATPVGFRESEWESLIVRVCNINLTIETKPKFANLWMGSALGLGTTAGGNTLCQETYNGPGNYNMAVIRGNVGQPGYISSTNKGNNSANMGWRPVLEYIPW